MKDELGDRIKAQYEDRTRYYLPRRAYTIVRVDGKGFHRYTRGLARPFDLDLMADMDTTAAHLCAEIAGCAFAYVQSDEISLLLTDFAAPGTQAWFDGNLQKIVSIAASLATVAFNRARMARCIHALNGSATPEDAIANATNTREHAGSVAESAAPPNPDALNATLALDAPWACFDARAFTIADPTEVENYFIWRQQDATRNSISMAAHSVCSHHDLQGKGSDALQEMLWQAGINWNDYADGCKRGRCVTRTTRRETVTYTHRKTGEVETVVADRHFWQTEAPPVFTRDRAYLAARIPRYP